MRKLRLHCSVLIAALALVALAPSAAQASRFTVAEYPTMVKGTQITELFAENYFELFGGAKVSCKVGNYQGALSEASSTLSLSLDYTGCETSFGTEATIDTNGCSYLLHTGAEFTSDNFGGSADLVCPGGKEMTLTMGLCTVHIAPYVSDPGVSFRDLTPFPGEVNAEFDTHPLVNVTNVFLCPAKAGVQFATFKSFVRLKFYKSSGFGQLGALID